MRLAVIAASVLLLVPAAAGQPVPDPEPNRFAAEIEAFEAWDAKNTPPSEPVLFIGSSSIRMWDTARSFDPLAVMNRGFGGAQISDILAYWDRAAAPYDPSAIVIYCGDNDVADGKPVEQVVADVWAPMVETGTPPDSSLFLDDGLHLSQEGYGIWQRVVAAALNRVLH